MRITSFLLILIATLCQPLFSPAQYPAKTDTSATAAPPAEKTNTVAAAKTAKDSPNVAGKDASTISKTAAIAEKEAEDETAECAHCNSCAVGWGWILVLMPLFIFLFLMSMFRKGLKEFSIQGALSENSNDNITKENLQYTKDNMKDLLTAAGGGSPSTLANLSSLLPPTIQVTTHDAAGLPIKDFRPSSSRLIAFISGILLLAIAFGMSSFYIYFYLCSGIAPDLSNLSGVLLALGLGMAPYALNKVSNAINNQTGK